MDVFARIDQTRCEWDVLGHPFYERWSRGELSGEELSFYAGQYRHAVVALAQASSNLAESAGAEHAPGLRRHAGEEAAHVELWDEFIKGATGDGRTDVDARAEQPLPGTQACVRAWTGGEDALEQLAVLYAIEASQPEIAKTKLAGLVAHYGYAEGGPASEYFRLHATLDVEHAGQARELIERLMSEDEAGAQDQADRMVARAEDALRGNWLLLDGVQGGFARRAPSCV